MSDELLRWKLAGAERCEAGIVVHGPDTTILWANAKAADMLGIAQDVLTGKLASDPGFRLLDDKGESLPLERYPVMEVLRTRARVADRVVGAILAGEERWGQISAEPIFEGEALGAVVVTFVDVTELQRARRDLAESEARLALAVAGTSDGLWEADAVTHTAWYAPRFEEILGLPPGTLRRDVNAWRERVHPDDLAHLDRAAAEHFADRRPYAVRYRIRHADGSWRTVEARAEAVRDERGAPVRMGGSIRDITEEVRAAEARARIEKKLEATARLESMAVLAGGVAHDFNNLLVGMMGAAEACREVLDSGPEAEELLDVITTSAERAAELTRQLMAYAGRAPFVVEVVSPPEELTDLVRLVRGALPSGAEIDLALDPNVPAIEVDPTQFRQVILNLVVNAAEAFEGQAGTVGVRAHRRDLDHAELARLESSGTPGPYAAIVVEDEGVGMDPSTQARIFEPFFTTKRSGHGLGLAAVHGMVRAHGGYVEVESVLGRGTRFEIGFPARDRRPIRRSPSGVEAHAWSSGARALLVEDETLVREVVGRLLALEGFEVELVADVWALDDALERSEPDLLVLDITLSGASGPRLFHRLRSERPVLPILLVSGHVDAADRFELRADEPIAFLPKPFGRTELRRALNRLRETAPSPSE